MEAGASPYKSIQRKPWWKHQVRWLFPCLLALGVAGGGGGVYALHHHDDSNSKLSLYERRDTCYLSDQDEVAKRAYAHRDKDTKEWEREVKKGVQVVSKYTVIPKGYQVYYHSDKSNPDLSIAIVETPSMSKARADQDRTQVKAYTHSRYVVLCEATVKSHLTNDIN